MADMADAIENLQGDANIIDSIENFQGDANIIDDIANNVQLNDFIAKPDTLVEPYVPETLPDMVGEPVIENVIEEMEILKEELDNFSLTKPHHAESWLGTIFGTIYTTIWALAWYPQIYQNYKDKSAIGYCYDLVVYNVYGFILYSIYTITQYTYQNEHELEEAVDWQDIFFAVHSLAINLFYMGQSWYYDGRPPFIGIGYFCRMYIYFTMLILLVHFLFALFGWITWVSVPGAVDSFGKVEESWSVVECMGIIKAVITVIKYPSQVVFNYDRQSTQGMNVIGFVMDLTGGAAALAQNLSDSIIFNDFAFMTANLPKVIVAGSSVFWDALLIIQGWVLYRNRDPLPVESRISYLKPTNFVSKITVFFAPAPWPPAPILEEEHTPTTIKNLRTTEIPNQPLWHDGTSDHPTGDNPTGDVEIPTLVRFDYDADDTNDIMVTPYALRSKRDLVLH